MKEPRELFYFCFFDTIKNRRKKKSSHADRYCLANHITERSTNAQNVKSKDLPLVEEPTIRR